MKQKFIGYITIEVPKPIILHDYVNYDLIGKRQDVLCLPNTIGLEYLEHGIWVSNQNPFVFPPDNEIQAEDLDDANKKLSKIFISDYDHHIFHRLFLPLVPTGEFSWLMKFGAVRILKGTPIKIHELQVIDAKLETENY